MNYRYGEFVGFMNASNDLEKRQLRQMVLAMRIAGADAKAFKKFMDDN